MKEKYTQVKLSLRLTMIANQVPEGSRIADIGSDHALLPVYLAQQGIIKSGIAGELNEGPFLAASKQVQLNNLEHIISVRHGDGLSVLGANEVDTIVIAGMGGSTMVSILEQGLHHLTGVKRLIVQPNVGEIALREWFIQENWLLQEEYILEEDGLIYEILIAVPANMDALKREQDDLYKPFVRSNGFPVNSYLLKLMGPYLIRESNLTFKAKWLQEIGKREWIINHLSRSEQAESLVKRKQLEAEIISIRSASQDGSTSN
ncbi:MAG: class I SAM-dependent methyltransferase [Paenibacillaceae bacterium]